jgi:hypothetical protein
VASLEVPVPLVRQHRGTEFPGKLMPSRKIVQAARGTPSSHRHLIGHSFFHRVAGLADGRPSLVADCRAFALQTVAPGEALTPSPSLVSARLT